MPCSRAGLPVLLGLLAVVLAPVSATASGSNLDGRIAPNLVFPDGVGVRPGTRLSEYRGKVVWIKFVLRDCPRCRASLPAMQARHELWAGSGLVALAVMHELGPRELKAWQRRDGVDFPVAQDPRGLLARQYGVGHRPADYVIGIDGRVRQSNGASDAVLRAELKRYRLRRLGDVPEPMADARDAVGRWDFGQALRLAEPRASAPEAEAAVRAAMSRIETLAREELAGRVAYARRLAARGKMVEARDYLDRVRAHFVGTRLEAEATAARASLDEKVPRRR